MFLSLQELETFPRLYTRDCMQDSGYVGSKKFPKVGQCNPMGIKALVLKDESAISGIIASSGGASSNKTAAAAVDESDRRPPEEYDEPWDHKLRKHQQGDTPGTGEHGTIACVLIVRSPFWEKDLLTCWRMLKQEKSQNVLLLARFSVTFFCSLIGWLL